MSSRTQANARRRRTTIRFVLVQVPVRPEATLFVWRANVASVSKNRQGKTHLSKWCDNDDDEVCVAIGQRRRCNNVCVY